MASSTQDAAQITVSCTTEYPAYKPEKVSKCWGLVTLKASDYEPEESKRPALDIVAVIDKSGSMQGEKLFLVKKSLKFLVQNLLEKDRLSLITYDTRVAVDFELLSMNKDNKEYAITKIESIECGSSTNLCGGLLQGLCTILDRGETKNDVASVLLLTDGLANHGITGKTKIIKAMKDPKKYLKRSGSETLDPDMFMNYQRNSTAGASCSNVSPSSKKSSFSRSLKGIAKFFTPSTMQEAPTQNVCLNEEDEQQNSIEVQQNIVPQPVQNLHVQQTVQQPTENVQQPAESEAHPEQPVQAPEQQVKPEEALQQPAQETQSEKEDKTVKEEKDKSYISVYTFGFGNDHDPDLLKAISDAAHGMYYFIENEEQISESFGHCFGGLVSTLGQNIKLTLELCNDVTLDALHTEQNYKCDDKKQKWEVQLGDMQSEEERDVLLTLNLPSTDSSTATVLKSSIKYFCTVDSSYKSFDTEMTVNRSADAEYSSKVANLAIDRQRNRILTTKATREALKLADEGNLKSARQRLQDQINAVKKSLTHADELCKLLVKDMEMSLHGLRDHDSYNLSGRYHQTNLLQMHSNQRSNRTDEMSSYVTKSKVSYMHKFK